ELPLAPASAPRASSRSTPPRVWQSDSSRAATAERAVCSRLVPVSPSATGNTLIRSIASRSAVSRASARSAQRRAAAAFSVRSIQTSTAAVDVPATDPSRAAAGPRGPRPAPCLGGYRRVGYTDPVLGGDGP